jgi:hypothetical protein
MLGPSPYALTAHVFPFRALTALAGSAPLGGPRETALATLVSARLAAGAAPPVLLSLTLRAARADAARLWLTSVALPPAVRTAVLRLVDATAVADSPSVAAALAKVTEVTAPHLDKGARSELDRLGARLTG